MRKVLFVSKPVAPPWHDGSKNLVRDVATHLQRVSATVMVPKGTPVRELEGLVKTQAIYTDSGTFAPAFAANARVFAALARDVSHDIWAFVFAPNTVSSAAARAAIAVRRMRTPVSVVQIVASPPRDMGTALFFGDEIVVMSEHTKRSLAQAGVRARVIAPCSRAPQVSAARIAEVRKALGLDSRPLVVYPGDYESDAAMTVAKAHFDARVVFACRTKSGRSEKARAEIMKLTPDAIHAGTIDDMPALLAASSLVVFPASKIEDKVDVPLVIVEALALGVPLVLGRGGPLEEVPSARHVPAGDPKALEIAVVELLEDGRARQALSDAARAVYKERFEPSVVASAYDELFAVC